VLGSKASGKGTCPEKKKMKKEKTKKRGGGDVNVRRQWAHVPRTCEGDFWEVQLFAC
jgi:hypothetical protein